MREREGRRGAGEERERESNLMFHLFMHSWLLLVCALTEEGIHHLGISGHHANQLSCLPVLTSISSLFFCLESRILG